MMPQRLILSFLACLVLSTAQAQKFELLDMFRYFRDNCNGYTIKSVYGTQWTLTTDGHNGYFGDDIALHIGTGNKGVSYATIESVESFDHVKAINVDAELKYSYTITITVGVKTFSYQKTDGDGKDFVQHTASFDGDTGKVSVRFEFPSFQNKQMYIKSIEVVTGLDDTDKTVEKVRQGTTASYSVNRTFSKDYWNTICLPFDVNEVNVNEIFGSNRKLQQFAEEVDANGTMLFERTNEIKAGVPYLLKPAKTVKAPTFTNVVYNGVEPKEVKDKTKTFSFVGTYDPVKLATDGSELFLGDGDKLYKPSTSGNRMNGMRAFFRIRKSSSASAKAKYSIKFEGETTTVKTINTDRRPTANRTYTLQGIAVDDTKPLLPGIYIRNGKKIYVRK